MKRFATIIFILISGLFTLTGCDVQGMIEDLTTRDITIDHTVYSGTLKQSGKTATILEDTTLEARERIEAEIDLREMADSIYFLEENLDPAGLSIEGKLSNPSSETTRLILSIASTNDPAKAVPFASVTLAPQEELEIMAGKGLDQESGLVESDLRDFFMENQDIAAAFLYAETKGNGDARVRIHWLDLAASPAYQQVRPIPGSLISGASDNVKSISSVSLHGAVANFSESEIRFILILGYQGEGPDFENGQVADGYIAPNSARDIEDMIVEKGLPRLKNSLYDVIDGENVEWHMLILGTETLDVEIDRIEFEAEVTVGL